MTERLEIWVLSFHPRLAAAWTKQLKGAPVRLPRRSGLLRLHSIVNESPEREREREESKSEQTWGCELHQAAWYGFPVRKEGQRETEREGWRSAKRTRREEMLAFVLTHLLWWCSGMLFKLPDQDVPSTYCRGWHVLILSVVRWFSLSNIYLELV